MKRAACRLLLVCLSPTAVAQAAPETALQAGLRAYAEGRYEEAATQLAAAQAQTPTFDGWLTLGLAYGRTQRFAQARQAFDAALALDARRPEAWLERGGLAFLERDYPAATRDLEQALLRAPTDAYARDLLATSLHLAGRGEDALRVWNRAGQPLLARLTLSGLEATRERVVRRELTLSEGDVLSLGDLRRSRLRLRELGIFERLTLRPSPLGDGRADLEAAFVERHGLYTTRVEFAASSAILATQGRARLRYANLGGAAVNLGAEWRWQTRRPQVGLYAELPRPFGLPATLRVQGARGRQAYDSGGEVSAHTRSLDVVVRHVAGPGTLVQLDLRARSRRFSRPRADAPQGLVLGPELGLEQRLLDGGRLELDAGLRLFHSLTALGADLSYGRAIATLEGRVFLASRDGTAVERSLLAFRLRAGRAGAATPLDELFAPGASPEMELPLRAHRQLRRGVIGATPMGRALVLGNVEWRRRVWSSAALQTGLVAFYDGARIAAREPATAARLHDVGLGLRVALRGAATLRADYAWSLSDRGRSFSLGLGQVF